MGARNISVWNSKVKFSFEKVDFKDNRELRTTAVRENNKLPEEDERSMYVDTTFYAKLSDKKYSDCMMNGHHKLM